MNDAFLYKGFTLMEILIAIAVFSIIILVLFSAFTGFMAAGDRITGSIDRDERARVAIRRLACDFDLLYITQPPRYRPPEFGDEPDPYRFYLVRENCGNQSFSRVEFATLAAVNTQGERRQRLVRVIYYAEKNNREMINLYRFQTGLSGTGQPDACKDPVVAEDIMRFEMTGCTRQGDAFETWDSDTEQNDFQIPDHVGLDLVLNDKDKGTLSLSTMFKIRTEREGT